MFSFSTRLSSAVLGIGSLLLGGCTSLLGDFSYSDNPAGSGGESGRNPAAGYIAVMPASGLVTSEQGAKATFMVVLEREPKNDVLIGLTSSNPGEGKVSPSSLLFSKENFAAPQMVQVTGVDDDKEDGPQLYTILTSPAASEDGDFLGKDAIDPQVTNTDDDTAGFTLTPSMGLVTTESGGEAMFTVRLNHAPTADVQVSLSTDKPTEGIVGPSALTFTSLNWMAPQVVTVTGVDDKEKDGPQKFLVVTSKASSTDPKYDGLEVPDQEVTNNDNDTAGIVLTPASMLVTFEPSLMTSLTVALSSPPTGKVTVGLASSDESEGLVSPASLDFTPENWMAPQVVSVTAVDDTRADGDQPYQVVTSILASEDADYLTLSPLPRADVVNVDDDTPNLVIAANPELKTSEDSLAAVFTVALLTKPSGSVMLDVASDREAEGIATPPLLTFTAENWAAPQTVTVMGVNDDVADGPQSYIVRVKPNAATGDPAYLALLERDVMLTNVDNDSAGVLVEPTKGLLTTEGGGTASFTVKLTSKPRAAVSISLSSSDGTEGTVSPNKVSFTPENYGSAQLVTVRGVNDDGQDGDQPFRIVTEAPQSEDADYAKLDVPNVEVSNQDDDSAGITVEPKDRTLNTNETGQTATFTVRLNSLPTADVNLTLFSSNELEGKVSPTSLKFTPANWRATQTVTVKGQDDKINDGAQAYRISFGPVLSDDRNYGADPQKLRPLDVKCSNQDDDSASIRLINATNLTTSEKSGSSPATFQVALGSQPRANVSISLSSSRTGEGTVSPAMLQFSPLNWSSPQIVTVTGVDEKVQDGPQTFFVLLAPSKSDDGDYQNLLPNPSNVTVINQDDDSAGIFVKASPTLATGEPAATATFTVELTSQPTADVVVPLASSNKAEGTVSPASLTFTPANWSAPRTVTLTGVDDPVQDGDQTYFVSVGPSTSTDGKYNPKTVPDVKVVNKDNDTAGIVVSPISGDTTEVGGSASFTIALQTRPKANVKLSLSSTRTTEGTVSPASVTFTTADWASPQKITVLGVDDDVQDGDQPYTIDVGAASAVGDPEYNEMDPSDVSVTNRDNDTAGILVTQLSSETSETGAAASFTIVLKTRPAGGASVSVKLKSSNANEGVLSEDEVTFTSADWASPQVITVTGVNDDGTADGDQPYTVTFGAAVSADTKYAGTQLLPLSFVNLDKDSAGIIVNPKTGQTTEDLETMSFTVVLQSKPKANVVIPVSSSDTSEGTVTGSATPLKLTFTPANWNAKQTVTVTGVNDDDNDGSPAYTVVLGLPESTDEAYAELDPPDVSLINVDNDTAGIVVTPAAGNTTEAGGTTTFSVRLRSKPKGNVTIPLATSDDTEGSLTIASVVLSPSDWSTPHVVTVHGEDDMEADGEQPYTIITGASASPDPDYNGVSVDDVSVKNEDNDTAGYSVSAPSGNTNEGGGSATFTIALKSQPAGPVSIPISSSNTAEGTVAVAAVDFSTANWKTPQTVTVKGVNDDVADGGIEYKVVLGKPTSTDVNYATKEPPDVTLTNDDDDSAAFTISTPAVTSTGEAATADSVSFTVVLTSKPKAPVSIAVSSSNAMEGLVTDPPLGVLKFTTTDWDTPQSVTITGVNDEEVDGDKPYSITVGPPDTSDPGYQVLPAQTVNLTNLDDD